MFWRGVRDSAEVYAQCLERLEQGEPLGLRQPEKGRLYLFRQRTLRHERQLRAKLAAGLLKGVQFPVRVRWFPSTSDAPETRRDLGAYHRARPRPWRPRCPCSVAFTNS